VRRLNLICSILISVFSAAVFVAPPILGEETKTIWVAHRQVDCIGVTPQKCYLIKDTQYEDWRFWYGEIAGFDYEEGYAYEIRVVERTVENPPADAAAVRLELVEVILKVETFENSEITRSSPTSQAAEPTITEQVPPDPAKTPLPEPVPAEPVEPVIPQPAPAAPERIQEPAAESPEPDLTPAPAVEELPIPPAVIPSPVTEHTSPEIPGGEVFRGHLSIGAGIEARSFKLCGAEESLWVEDRTDADLWALYRRLASYPNRPVFMEITGEILAAPAAGFGAHFQQQIKIRHVRNASVESAGCFAEPATYMFRASGNEPFWNVEISKRGLAFSELGQEERLLFPYSPPTFFAEQIIFRSQIRGQNARTIVVRLEEKACSDSMADATFSFTVSVKIDDRILEGCAREGEETF